MQKKHLLTLLLFAVAIFSYGAIPVSFDQKDLSYMGRVEMISNQCARIFWPGTSVTLNFKGTEVKAIFKDQSGRNYFYAIVDGDDSNPVKIKPDSVKSSLVLASGLKNGTHSIQLFKLTNNTSYTDFYGFELPDGAKVLKAKPLPKRKIEFYGNSITAGHGVDVLPKDIDSGSPFYFNNYLTYAARTARHFNAQYSCIARSGIGLMVSWFPIIMPEMYDRLNPDEPDSKWDFSKYTPDIVVINLTQNDSWIVEKPDFPEFKARFGTTRPDDATIVTAYQNFVRRIRAKYPNAHIICVLGNMDATREGSKWPGYVEAAVKGLSDSKVYSHIFPYKNTPGHPKVTEQKDMADDLINFIDKNIKW